ncbi:MAG: arginase family protein, partial [Pseudomonadota bacterium]
MTQKTIALFGAPSQAGTHQPGCLMGPDAYRCASIVESLAMLGHRVEDRGNLAPPLRSHRNHANAHVHHLGDVKAWAEIISAATLDAARSSDMPVILGGDHSISVGTVPALAQHAAASGQPLFVLWLDAHPDLHLLETTASGNLHGTPVAYFLGERGFEGFYPDLPALVEPGNFCALGVRSVDPAERARISAPGRDGPEQRANDQHRIKTPRGCLHA